MTYHRIANLSLIVDRPAELAASNNPGPYYPCVATDARGQAAPVEVGGSQYYALYFSSDHGNGGDSSTGIYVYLCAVGDDIASPASWVDVGSVAGSANSNPIPVGVPTEAPSASQPETPTVRKVGFDSWVMTIHFDASADLGRQATVTYKSQNGLDWNYVGISFPEPGPTEMPRTHDGYFRWARNDSLAGIDFDYIGWSLYSWGSGNSRFRNTMMWGTNDPSKALAWQRIRIEGLGSLPDSFEEFRADQRPHFAEIAAPSLRSLNGDASAALISVVSAASGGAARSSSLAEVVLGKSGDLISQPRAVLTNSDGTDFSSEVGNPDAFMIGGVSYVVFQAADELNVNRILLASVEFDEMGVQPETFAPTATVRQEDATSLTVLPFYMSNEIDTVVTFDPQDGMVVTSPSGNFGLVRLDSPFVPDDFDVVDVFFEGLRSSKDTDIPAIGFMRDSDVDWPRNAPQAILVQTFNSANGAAVIVEDNGASATETQTDHLLGNNASQGRDLYKSIGVRWWPKLREVALLGEGGKVLWRIAATQPIDASQPFVPIASIRDTSTGGASVSFRGVRVGFDDGSVPSFRVLPARECQDGRAVAAAVHAHPDAVAERAKTASIRARTDAMPIQGEPRQITEGDNPPRNITIGPVSTG